MSRNEKKRIDTSGGQSLSAGSFGALDALGGIALPAAPLRESATVNADATKDAASAAPVRRGRVDVRREKAGRGGKVVTVLGGEAFAAESADALDALFKSLKNRFGCGGTRNGATIELQGDLVVPVIAELTALGYRAVRCGG